MLTHLAGPVSGYIWRAAASQPAVQYDCGASGSGLARLEAVMTQANYALRLQLSLKAEPAVIALLDRLGSDDQPQAGDETE